MVYFNKKFSADGYNWDSKGEYEYYQELCLLKKVGEIIIFKVKPKIILQEKPKITFTPDFIVYKHGLTEFVDVKGRGYKRSIGWPAWNIKWKWLQGKYINDKNYKFKIVEL